MIVMRGAGAGPRHSSLSTSPSRPALVPSDPGADQPQFYVFEAEIAGQTDSALKVGAIGSVLLASQQ
jgi:hypothetical protein